jgi:hypothetical protein
MPVEYAKHGVSLRSMSVPKMLYAHNTVVHSFSARLTEQEASDMAGIDPGTRYELHSPRTPEFAVVEQNVLVSSPAPPGTPGLGAPHSPTWRCGSPPWAPAPSTATSRRMSPWRNGVA